MAPRKVAQKATSNVARSISAIRDNTRIAKNADDAASIIAAAASLATAAVASAASTATATLTSAASTAIATLTEAASLAAKVVTDASAKAVSEFPRLQDDIREIRSNQSQEGASLTKVVTSLLEAHTQVEEVRLTSIEATCTKIDAHLVEHGDRLTTAEKHITRHQLVLFGIAGPVCLLVIATVLTILAKNFAATLSAWLQ